MKKVVIYGVLQIVGFHLCTRLLEDGIFVVGIHDNKTNENVREEMLFSIGRNANFQYRDFVMEEDFEATDLFFHVSDEPTPMSQLERMITFCDRYDVPIVYLSSVEVYGNGTNMTEDSPLQPVTPLGKWRKQEELLLRSAFKNDKRKLLIFRIPSIYGPWQNQHDELHKIIYAHIKKNSSEKLEEELVKQSYSKKYLYVSDVVDVMIDAINHGEYYGEIFNLSADEAVSSEKAKKWLKFQSKYSFQKGIDMQKTHIYKQLKFNPTIYES